MTGMTGSCRVTKQPVMAVRPTQQGLEQCYVGYDGLTALSYSKVDSHGCTMCSRLPQDGLDQAAPMRPPRGYARLYSYPVAPTPQHNSCALRHGYQLYIVQVDRGGQPRPSVAFALNLAEITFGGNHD